MKKYTVVRNGQAKDKQPEALDPRARLALEGQLPMKELISAVRQDVEAFAAQLGLTVIQRVMEAEIQKKLGPWGKQSIYRHGHQPGYVIYGGRKVSLVRPRLRSREANEVALASYKAFQSNGKMQQSVARQLTRQCSTRDYEGAIESCLKGYGISRSSVSRHWKAATAEQLQKLMERPVPQELLALMIDSKFFAGECLVAAVGIDSQGRKHVLGLWHGATENTTVVQGLLEDLVSRGLESEHKILVVIDGAKALHKAVKKVLGEQALVQRCRLHKMRNVVDQLPERIKTHVGQRMRAAWAKKEPHQAERALRNIADGLEESWPNAASSLREGLEETLTVQRLKLPSNLCRTLSNTNIIENCFSVVAHQVRRVKRWNRAGMILRWTAAALLKAEKNFKRINGCDQLKQLNDVLRDMEKQPTLKAA